MSKAAKLEDQVKVLKITLQRGMAERDTKMISLNF